MTADINLGNYEIDEDGNGNLVIKDSTDTAVLEHTDGDGWTVRGELDLNENNIPNVGQVTPERVTGDYHYAGAYPGSDPDARLDNAVADANPGETVLLEDATYDADRTIDVGGLRISGTGNAARGSIINAAWTLNDGQLLENLGDVLDSASIELTFQTALIHSFLRSGATVTVSGNRARFIGNQGGDVTFQSGTESGVVDSCTSTTVTDNGTNTIGDIS